jgi:hypothetical protein
MKLIPIIVRAGLAAFAVTATASADVARAEPAILKLGNVQAPAAVVQKGLQRFADLAHERTGGAVEVKVFPASQLGTEQEILVKIGARIMRHGRYWSSSSPRWRCRERCRRDPESDRPPARAARRCGP